MSITKLRELGVMVDCSRNAVMNIPALKELIKICHEFGYDYIGLYTEDTIEVTGEPYFGHQRGRYTREEIQEADTYAHSLGMELRPYIQTLAHINQITGYTEYSECIDVNDILLVGNPRTEQLIDNIFKTVSETYSTRKVNIGMDEAHMVGLGKYLELHGYRNRVDIILEHLELVVKICKKYGLQPQMWSDMFFRLLTAGAYGTENSEAAKELSENLSKIKIPDGLELVYWDYYSTDEKHYEMILDQHKALTSNTSFAGGAWRWMGFAPYNSYSLLITKAAIKACLSKDIDSVAMTAWGDDGTECSIFAVLPVLYEAPRLGGKLPTDNNSGSKEDKVQTFTAITGYTLEEFMLLDLVNPNCEGKKKNNLSKILLFNDPLLGSFDSLVPDGISSYYEKTAQKLFDVTRKGERRFDHIFDSMGKLCLVLAHKADFGCRLRKAYQANNTQTLKVIAKEIPQIINLLDAFYEAFRKQWLYENKSYGFEVQTVRIGGLKQRLADIALYLDDYLGGRLDKIQELETETLPVGYILEGASANEAEFSSYQKLVTTSRLSW
ncbi:Glycosyl hydrolase family 20, catalytic domain [Butyrivibrio sp. ob235]|uniref:beta-N-acetylhexosaminidase n=1 Tax=Butyrivibrio sp. ob235 TaxID=1761780 RepID=UPI0008B351F5|nr:beta-N-acetylhexosaminidase [Butyrivibrio sp. ob235]SEL43461.1 Glycosyl hydrolase family 20, catalytic domain [Butyrivibrio sp. ob235]